LFTIGSRGKHESRWTWILCCQVEKLQTFANATLIAKDGQLYEPFDAEVNQLVKMASKTSSLTRLYNVSDGMMETFL
jgi:hypothetical protein